MKIAVIGSGGWGLSMAKHLYGNGHEVACWCHSEAGAEELRRTRGRENLLPGILLDSDIEISTDFAISRTAEIIVMATPSHGVAEVAEGMRLHINKKQICVLLSKGLDSKNGYSLLSQTLEKKWDGLLPVVVLTGPCHAEELAKGVPTALVAASRDSAAAALVQSVFMNECLKIYTTGDVVSAQLGGAMKNIMAMAVGVSDGVGFGDNTRAMIMTRGIAEMSRLGVVLGGKAETFSGLSGVGDLIGTCISQHSRNRRAGLLIGGGLSPRQAIEQVGGVVEGFFATKAVHELTKGMGIDLPICNAMYKLLYECVPMADVVGALLARGAKPECDPDLVSDSD